MPCLALVPDRSCWLFNPVEMIQPGMMAPRVRDPILDREVSVLSSRAHAQPVVGASPGLVAKLHFVSPANTICSATEYGKLVDYSQVTETGLADD
jgi:hypothetical protein